MMTMLSIDYGSEDIMQEAGQSNEEYGAERLGERYQAGNDNSYERSLEESPKMSKERPWLSEEAREERLDKGENDLEEQRAPLEIRPAYQERYQNQSNAGREDINSEKYPVFSQAFANEPDRGYNVFFQRLEDGRRSLKHLAKHIQARIDIEEDYSKKLSKWSREGRDNLEIGSLQAALELSFSEYDSIANNRIKMVHELIDRVLAPLQGFSQHYKHIRESRREALHKSIKSREEQEHNVLRLRKNYDSKCHEAEQISIHQKKSLLGSGPDRAMRSNPKLERAQTSIEQAEREYRLSEEKLRLLTTSWENDMIRLAEDFQDAENEHINQIKSVFVDFSDICIRCDKLEINENERIRNAFAQVDNLSVINEFVAQRAPRRKDVEEPDRPRTQTDLMPTSSAVSGKERVSPFEAKVLYTYKAQKPEELTLEEGGLVRVVSTKDAPWWEGEFKGVRGVFPSNYVARVA